MKINLDRLAREIKNNPDITTSELAKIFNVQTGTVRKAIEKYGREPSESMRAEMRKEKLGKDYIKITPEIESRINHALEGHYDLQNCESEDEREKFVNNFIKMDFGDQFVELSLDCLMSQRDIAKIYDVSDQAVSNRLRSHDRYIAHLESEKELAKRIEKRVVKFVPRNQHLTINELARQFGIARETLVKILKRNGIKKKNVTTSTDMEAVNKVRKIIADNPDVTQTEIAEKLGIGQSTVSKYIRLFNIEYKRKS